MSSINQLVSEIAHSVGQVDSVPARQAIRLSIIHARNELIRKSYSNHHFTDKVLKQRFRISIKDVPDGDLNNTNLELVKGIKRTTNKVPRPTRIDNGIPFHSVRTVGVINPINIPFIGEGAAVFYKHLPGMENTPSYDYINEYIYINNLDTSINNIVVEGVFEYPQIIPIEVSEESEPNINIDDNNEFLLPEDMIESVKKMVLETFNAQVIRETNEVKNINLVK